MSTLSSANVTDVNLVLKERAHKIKMKYFMHQYSNSYTYFRQLPTYLHLWREQPRCSCGSAGLKQSAIQHISFTFIWKLLRLELTDTAHRHFSVICASEILLLTYLLTYFISSSLFCCVQVRKAVLDCQVIAVFQVWMDLMVVLALLDVRVNQDLTAYEASHTGPISLCVEWIDSFVLICVFCVLLFHTA